MSDVFSFQNSETFTETSTETSTETATETSTETFTQTLCKCEPMYAILCKSFRLGKNYVL